MSGGRARRVWLLVGGLVLLVAVVVLGLLGSRDEEAARRRIEVVVEAPGITITAPDGSTHRDRLQLLIGPEFTDWVLGPPQQSMHMAVADPATVLARWLPILAPGSGPMTRFGTGWYASPDGVVRDIIHAIPEKGPDRTRSLLIIVERPAGGRERGCVVRLESDGRPFRSELSLEERGTFGEIVGRAGTRAVVTATREP